MPCLPRKTKVYVTKCHACHAKRRWMSPSATPATQNEGGCRQVPRLPRKVPRRHRRPIRSKRACHAKRRWMWPSATPATLSRRLCERRWMSPSATPATQNEGGCRQVPRLPRKVPRRHRRPIRSKRACHAKRRWMWPSATPATLSRRLCERRWMSPSATPATQNEGGCRQVPCLPRKVPRRHRRLIRSKRATKASPVP